MEKLTVFDMTSDSAKPGPTMEDWTLLRSRLLWCYEGEVEAKFRRLAATRRHLSAWLLTAGEATVSRGRKRWSATAGRWMLAGPESFEQEFSPGARILSVNFVLEWPSGESLVEQPLVVDEVRYPELAREGRALARFVEKTFPGAYVDLWRARAGVEEFFGLQQRFAGWVRAYLGAVLAEGVSPVRMRGEEPRVREALRRLDRQPWGVPLRDRELAAAVGLSAGHLERLFGRDLGLTPRAYRQKRRLDTALAALADRTVPVKQVAAELGFGSVSHFSHWLKQATGKSPRAHRDAGATSPVA